MAIIERKFDGEVYTLHGIRQSKSWAQKEAKELRKEGFKVRNTKFLNDFGSTYYYVWKRHKKDKKVEYKDLHKLLLRNGEQHIAHNVSCGLVNYDGERIIGCGRQATLDSPNYGYYYQRDGLTSTVYLCKRCKKNVGKKKEKEKPKKFKGKYADYWKFEGGY